MTTDTSAGSSQEAGGGNSSASSLAAKLTSFVIFQVVYTACVLGAARGWLWAGPLSAVLLLPINLRFVPRGSRLPELRLWALVGLIGFVVDSALLRSGLIGFPEITRFAPGAALTGWLVPPWIVVLWIAVGSILHSSLGWLAGKPLLAIVLGAIGGPFSFWSGSRFGAVELPRGNLTLAALALEYAVIMPVLLALAYPSSPPERSGHAPGH
ncbi:hypothetical protein Poly30_35840 [Planctomycetes bacterium Poly30]|uniref:DUF2878 domain-containing protein n=1 Tax=Saltatorellus ferox TaxID=2528018 RepID=A0A518EVG1_9BACT|nr:hypothetical protein Poly30_35840 [Planctomycetes bacterium Poly30]